MPKLSIKIGNSHYNIMCEEGDEDRIELLSEKIDTRFKSVAPSFQGASDQYILAVTALMMEDEIQSSPSGNTSSMTSSDKVIQSNSTPANDESELNTILHSVSERIEKLAISLENA